MLLGPRAIDLLVIRGVFPQREMDASSALPFCRTCASSLRESRDRPVLPIEDDVLFDKRVARFAG